MAYYLPWLSNGATGGTPSLTSATIQSTAATINLVFTEAVSVGTGGPGGFTVSLSGGAATVEYYSGNGTSTIVLVASRSIDSGETGTISYTQPGNGIEATSGGADVASFSGTTLINSSAGLPTYSSRLIINTGGEYTGNYQSTDANPAIDIQTTAAVTLKDCRIKGTSYPNLIKIVDGGNLTITGCTIRVLPGTYAGAPAARCINPGGAASLIIENNTFYYCTITPQGGTPNPLRIRNNKFYNATGRVSNGAGGYQGGQASLLQFMQIMWCRDMTACDVSWNQMVNDPDQSAIEDSISIYNSSGLSGTPINIHDNFIHGAYPVPAKTGSPYSGGGILTDGAGNERNGVNFTDVTQYIDLHHNQILTTTNYGMSICSGNNNAIYNNTILNCGALTEADYNSSSWITSLWTGIIFWNYYIVDSTYFFNNTISNNTVKWRGSGGSAIIDAERGGHVATWYPGCSITGNTTAWENCSWTEQEAEWNIWKIKLISNNKVVGSRLGG